MPATLTYPGVYIEEISSGVRTIMGVPTSVTAFIGRALRGPVEEPAVINGFGDYERIFGGLWSESTMSYAVKDFFQNGGGQGIIVRLHNGATRATITVPGGLDLRAKSHGVWGERLRVRVEHLTDPALYNLLVRDAATGEEERFLNVSTNVNSPRTVDKVLRQSRLVELVAAPAAAARPNDHPDPLIPGADPFLDPAAIPVQYTPANPDGDDGAAVTDGQFSGGGVSRANKTGIYALLKLENQIFNLLCIPPLTRTADVGAATTLTEALNLCLEKRAMLIVDAPAAWGDTAAAVAGMGNFSLSGDSARNAAMFFPRLRMPDSAQGGQLDNFAPCGVVAGIFSRTDTQRGVWKAPAGLDASLNGVPELSVRLTDAENGQLNPLGLNCLRSFPVVGRVVWGSRTLRGADQLASEWKYVPVRRTALFIEESLYRGTQWVVFEPNDEPLWAQIRLNVGAFMNSLFRQGAFQGTTPKDAYFVKCDKETNPQNDIDRGIVNIIVGFAPLKPAEFVVIKLQQIAGQIQT
jgi:phage tail sheath protein FI